jgi:hypothetical protein
MVGGAERLKALIDGGKNPQIITTFKYLGDKNHASILHEAVYKAFESFKTPPQ